MPGRRRCLADHPALSVRVRKPETEKPFYEASSIENLEKHIEILSQSEIADDIAAIEDVTPSLLDTKPFTDAPGWKIVVLPLKTADDSVTKKCFIAFSFSHSVGDGISGLAFHKSFLAGLQDSTSSQDLKAAPGAMPEAFDTKKNLPISLGYLLAPALGQYLPRFLAKAFGLRAAVSTISPTTWLGNGTYFFKPDDHNSGAKLFSLSGETVSNLVQKCRSENTKLTSLLHQIIMHALSVVLPVEGVDSFASQTAINMRHHVDVSNDTMGLYVTGFFDTHDRTTDLSTIFARARNMNTKLHTCSNTLADQSIGLLRYLISMRSWTSGKLGGQKDSSYELSNLLAFDAGPQAEDAQWSLGNMIFAQPANVMGSPLNYNVAARKGGDLVCSVTWQVGALGQEDEGAFVEKVNDEIVRCIEQLIS